MPRRLSLFLLPLLLLFLPASLPLPLGFHAQVTLAAEPYPFNYTAWMMDSLWLKAKIGALGAPRFFSAAQQHEAAVRTLDLITQLRQTEDEIDRIYADPANAADPQAASAEARARLQRLTRQYDQVAPLGEAVLEAQVSEIVSQQGLVWGGQPFPWVLYHISPLPQNLVISRREVIEQRSNLLLDPWLSTQQAQALEEKVDSRFDVASLVVPVGGIALYPTMVYRTDDLPWLANTIAHEWIHIYLASYPLSLHYDDPQVRTMNETTASIAGEELGHLLLQRFYPERLNALPPDSQLAALAGIPNAEGFNFNAEMRTTRVTTDALLAAGKIDQAEAYMESRRQFFWQNGYAIRKLNQAYFAFYGAYADTPGGAAGEDPVGPAVRLLRQRSPSLKVFLETIREMGSFTELQAAVSQPK